MGHSTLATRVGVVKIPWAVPNEGEENDDVTLNCYRVKTYAAFIMSCVTTHLAMVPA